MMQNALKDAKDRLCIALDVHSGDEAQRIVRQVKDWVGMFKVGLELYTNEGPEIVRFINRSGGRVFLDLKFHDIPNTVAGAARAATKLGVFLFNVHASGGSEMMRCAAEAAQEEAMRSAVTRPKIIAVTVLTSLSTDVLRSELLATRTVTEHVVSLAELAQKAGMDGVIASPQETAAIRSACGKRFVIVTPGVRAEGSAANDQKRIETPRHAIENGADYLVVGRPILTAPDKVLACQQILKEIAAAAGQ